MIDRIRHDIRRRLEQLHAEASKLRRALVALDPRERSTAKFNPAGSRSSAPRSVTPAPAAKPAPAPARKPARAVSTANAGVSARPAPGQTKAKVVAALSGGQRLTAGEVASATGLARSTVSTTLSKLCKTGEVVKAERGYRLPSADGRSAGSARPADAS